MCITQQLEKKERPGIFYTTPRKHRHKYREIGGKYSTLVFFNGLINTNFTFRVINLVNFKFSDHLFQRIKRQALNEVDAYDICNEAFQQSAYFDTCLQIVPNFSNETLVNCINDLVVRNVTMN